jgi:hypothetical protein
VVGNHDRGQDILKKGKRNHKKGLLPRVWYVAIQYEDQSEEMVIGNDGNMMHS